MLLRLLLVASLLPLVVTADDISLRFRVYWGPDSKFESKFIHCVECEFHSSSNGSRCLEGDSLVIGKCGTSDRQRFVVDTDTNQIMPQGSPDLCITRQDDEIRLRRCNDTDPHQKWFGLHEEGPFELHQGNEGEDTDDLCFATEGKHPRSDDEVFAIDCQHSRQDRTSRWVLSNVEGPMVMRDSDDSDTECSDTCIEIYEGDDVLMEHNRLLARVDPIMTRKDITDFYCYYCHGDPSFNGDDVVTLVKDTSLAFVHQHQASCDLSLVLVHDSKEDYTGGQVSMFISGNLEKSVVQDGRNSPSDWFEYNADTDETECSWTWAWQNHKQYSTDGIATYWEPSDRQCLYVDADFIAGIDQWQFAPGPLPSSGSTNPEDYITINKNKRLWVCQCGSEDVERP